ncbi:MAG: YceI family protein [Pseudomonadota bacterium]
MILRATLAAALLATPAAADWAVDGAASSIGFVSIKNGDVAESHMFRAVSGGVSGDRAEVEIGLGSVETYIDIRNERMRKMLFDLEKFPIAAVSAQIDLAALEALEPGARTQLDTEVLVTANGAEAPYDARLNVTRLTADRVAVSAAEPVLLHVEDLGYGPGIEALREVAGLDAISPVVPVTFDLVFDLVE